MYDVIEKGFAVRISATGTKTFRSDCPVPGSNNFVRRALGKYPDMKTNAARAKTEAWKAEIARGVDPSAAERSEARAVIVAVETQAKAAKATFAIVVERYIDEYLLAMKRDGKPAVRSGEDVVRGIRREFGVLGMKTVTDIKASDITPIISLSSGVVRRTRLATF